MWPRNPTPGHIPWENHNSKATCTLKFTGALFRMDLFYFDWFGSWGSWSWTLLQTLGIILFIIVIILSPGMLYSLKTLNAMITVTDFQANVPKEHFLSFLKNNSLKFGHVSVKLSAAVPCSGTQSCSTLCDPMDCSPSGSSVHGILQARIMEWVVISFSSGASQSRAWTHTC